MEEMCGFMGDDMAEHGRIFQCLRRHIDGGREQSKKTGGANGIRLINRKAGLFAFYRLPGPPQAEGKVRLTAAKYAPIPSVPANQK